MHEGDNTRSHNWQSEPCSDIPFAIRIVDSIASLDDIHGHICPHCDRCTHTHDGLTKGLISNYGGTPVAPCISQHLDASVCVIS